MPGMPVPCCTAVASLRTLESLGNQAPSARRRMVLLGKVALLKRGTAPDTFSQSPDSGLILVYLLFRNLGNRTVTQMAGVAMETDMEQEC